MTTFERKIDINHLHDLDTGTVPWLDELFRFWVPAGSGCRPAPRQHYGSLFARAM